jgi:hypothetical protein
VACVGGLLVLDRRRVRYFGRAGGLLNNPVYLEEELA